MTNQTSPALTINAPEPKPLGFPGLACIKCGEENMARLDLQDLDTVTCCSCEAELSLSQDILPTLRQWLRVSRWVELMREVDEVEAAFGE